MNLTRVRSLVFVIVVVLCSFGRSGLSAQAPRPIKLWSAISVAQPVFRPSEVARLMLFFGVVNDGDTVANPDVESSHLLINGTEPKDWSFVIGNGIRTSEFTALPPGRALSFGYQLGSRYFGTPGIYTVQWEGQNFRSAEITFRVMPRE
jgi:hypothetical protein